MAQFGGKVNLSMPHFISAVWDDDEYYFSESSAGNNEPTSELLPGETQQGDSPVAVEQSLLAMILIAIIAIAIIFVTIVGNLLVLVSFAINRQLRILTNYFLLSLAVADCCIGFISMPLYSVFVLMGRWPFGAIICDLWLTFDYVLCNASVTNLLVICCDRYLSLTRPLTYRASRTPKKVFFMISSAWVLSIIVWSPWIFGWTLIEEQRTVPDDNCFIPFLYGGNKLTSQLVSVALTVVAFYGPVAAMCVLYLKVYGITRQRTNELKLLQANHRPSAGSTRPSQTDGRGSATTSITKRQSDTARPPECPRRTAPPRISHSMLTVQRSADVKSDESAYRPIILPSRPVSVALTTYELSDELRMPMETSSFFDASIFSGMRSIDSPSGEDESSANSSSDSASLRTTLLGKNGIVLSRLSLYLQDDGILKTMGPVISALRNGDITTICGESNALTQNKKIKSTSLSQISAAGWLTMSTRWQQQQQQRRTSIIPRVVFDEISMEPIAIRRPSHSSLSILASDASILPSSSRPLLANNSLDENSDVQRHVTVTLGSPRAEEVSAVGTPPDHGDNSMASENATMGDAFPEWKSRRQSMFAKFKDWSAKAFSPRGTMQMPLGVTIGRRRLTVDSDSVANKTDTSGSKTGQRSVSVLKPSRRVHDDKAAERKAAKMLTAILLVFVLTWLPYNVLTNITTFCSGCVPETLYQMSYWLCYINSTLNPLCYAYCNATFRNTFLHILRCKFVSFKNCFGKKRRSNSAAIDTHSRPMYRSSVRTESSSEFPATGLTSKSRVASGTFRRVPSHDFESTRYRNSSTANFESTMGLIQEVNSPSPKQSVASNHYGTTHNNRQCYK